MRSILFKAKRLDNGEWVEGFIVPKKLNTYPDGFEIIDVNGINYDELDMWQQMYTSYEIDPETICQYTGLTDKNGNKIWENDVVCTLYIDPIFKDIVNDEILNDFRWKVLFYDGCFCVENESDSIYLKDFVVGKHIEIVGNIFDNSDLLER